MLTQEGAIPFHSPTFSKPCHTWFKMIGNLESNITPLVILHGGPGACHEYLLPIEDLNEHKGIPIIFYDQIGNGRSTHFKEKEGDEEFWSEDLFRAELDNLIDYFELRRKGFDLYGHSWGGMFGSKYAAMQPRGLRKLVLTDASASVHLMLEGEKTLRAALPRDVQEVLTRCEEEEGRMDSEDYENTCEFSISDICAV